MEHRIENHPFTGEPLSKKVEVWLTPKTADAISKLADQHDTSESIIVEIALNYYLNETKETIQVGDKVSYILNGRGHIGYVLQPARRNPNLYEVSDTASTTGQVYVLSVDHLTKK